MNSEEMHAFFDLLTTIERDMTAVLRRNEELEKANLAISLSLEQARTTIDALRNVMDNNNRQRMRAEGYPNFAEKAETSRRDATAAD